MKSLQTVQKTFRVLQILTKIAFIFSIIGASLCAVGALFVAAWYTGGHAFSLFGEPMVLYSGSEDMRLTLAVLLSDLVCLTADAILLFFAGRYFHTEQAEGTPFTENGALLIRKLGIRCIYLPIVAIVLASVITVCLNVETGVDFSNLPGVVLGIVLIIASPVFRYGAGLEERNRFLHSDAVILERKES
ncbi:MAG: hypothetical protein ACI4RV_04680 [Eubacteriales bacterium]